MSTAEFYIDNGLNEDYGIDEWLAHQQDSLEDFGVGSIYGGGGGGGGGGSSGVGKRKRDPDAYNGGNKHTTCPACKKTFVNESAMSGHYRIKNDRVHQEYRQMHGKKPKLNSSCGGSGSSGGGGGSSGSGRAGCSDSGGGAMNTHSSIYETPPSREHVRMQVEFYFSDQALVKQCPFSGQLLPKDKFLLKEMGRTKGGWVRLSVLAAFPRLKLNVPNGDVTVIANAIEGSSTLELSESREQVRRVKPLPGSIGAMARGELVLLMDKTWVHAVWKDEEGLLHTDCEKNQQAQQLGCIAEKDVDTWFASGAAFPGAIDMRSETLVSHASCRWGIACPRLALDEEHTAAAHTTAEARLAEGKGATAALRALGGRWITESERRQKIEEVACQPDACPCFKGGSESCVMPGLHGRNYWQGAATVARLAQLEPGKDQSPQVWKAEREERRAARAAGVACLECSHPIFCRCPREDSTSM